MTVNSKGDKYKYFHGIIYIIMYYSIECKKHKYLEIHISIIAMYTRTIIDYC